jgi:hypothetical protein
MMNQMNLPPDQEAESLLKILSDPSAYRQKLVELNSKLQELAGREEKLAQGWKKLEAEKKRFKAILDDAA